MKKKILVIILFYFCIGNISIAQSVTWPKESIIALTPEWKGERFADGRPKIPDELLERLKGVSMEEAWAALRNAGYQNQFENFNGYAENPWIILHPDEPMTGRAVTAQYIPLRPDLQNYVQDQGKKEKNPLKITNSSPINILQDGDVYVADGYNKIIDGTLIGDNLGNAIAAGSKRGFIFNASIRDMEGNLKIKGYNGWFRGSDPSAISQMMLSTINAPIRIGRATVLPGDAVLAKNTGVMFIPAFLVSDLVLSGEYTHLLDQFTFERIKDKKYEYKNEGFVGGWTEVINNDFLNWLKNYPTLPMPRKDLDEYVKAHPHSIAGQEKEEVPQKKKN
ncbi:MAG: RraA family protein [Ginsengibacter sp.]